MEILNSVISGVVCPVVLLFFGIIFAVRLRFFYVLHPMKTLSGVCANAKNGFASLACALAGTLGVGNMAGVATALSMGGPGALVWMELGAFAAMGVKYMEVRLAMDTRVPTAEGYAGGAWFYIKKLSPSLASFFAVLCIINSYLTGNVVQVKAAASAFDVPPLFVGITVGVAALITASGGGRRILRACTCIIPVLCAVYLIASLYIIVKNGEKVPQIAVDAVKSAFSIRSAAGGALGLGVTRAMRYGITRGIFSNEAGCGTSPTAHAMSNSTDAHGQGCLGILEVFIDTTVLCTVTGLVILISGESGEDGIGVTLRAFTALAGEGVGRVIALSVVLFAFSTVICQASYGLGAVDYISRGRAGEILYLLGILLCCIAGSVIPEGFMWQIADLVISLMTVINTIVVYILTRQKKKGFRLWEPTVEDKSLTP